MVCVLLFLCWQETYFVDGTTFVLTDGTVIKTLAEIDQDAHTYHWIEDGEPVSLTKSTVERIDYFSFRLLGRAPKKAYKNIHQRRIKGQAIAFQRDGKTHLRVHHVDSAGRSMEGKQLHNLCEPLKIVDETQQPLTIRARLNRVKKESLVEIHFFNFDGKRVFSAHFDLRRDAFEVKDDETVLEFQLPTGLDVKHIGLVEVASVRAPADQDEK